MQCVILRMYVVVSIEWLLNSLEFGSSRVSGAAAAPVVVSSFASSCYMLCFFVAGIFSGTLVLTFTEIPCYSPCDKGRLPL